MPRVQYNPKWVIFYLHPRTKCPGTVVTAKAERDSFNLNGASTHFLPSNCSICSQEKTVGMPFKKEKKISKKKRDKM